MHFSDPSPTELFEQAAANSAGRVFAIRTLRIMKQCFESTLEKY